MFSVCVARCSGNKDAFSDFPPPKTHQRNNLRDVPYKFRYVGFDPSEHMSQNGNLPQIWVRIKKKNETTKLYGGLTFVAQGCWGKVGRSGLQPHLQFEGSIFRLSVFPTVFWKIPRPTDLNALRNKGFPYKGWSSHWLLMMPNSPKNHPLHKTPNMTHYTLSATKIYFLRSKYW